MPLMSSLSTAEPTSTQILRLTASTGICSAIIFTHWAGYAEWEQWRLKPDQDQLDQEQLHLTDVE